MAADRPGGRAPCWRRRSRPAQVVVVVDHNPALLERVRASVPRADRRARATRPARPLRRPATPGWPRRPARSSPSSTTTPRPSPTGWRDCCRDYRTTRVLGGRRPRRAGLGGGPAALVPPRVRLGGRAAATPASPTDVVPVRNVIGCNMSFRRSVLDADRRLRPGARPGRPDAGRLRGDGALHPDPAARTGQRGALRARAPGSATG